MTDTKSNGKTYFRSLNELENSPEFRDLLRREFPDVDPDKLPDVSRRRFLQLLGASAALASATGCRWEDEKIATFNERPDGRIPGVPQYFSTSMELGGVAYPLRMTCYDGRPVKTEGNPLHPESGGATNTYAQAAVLGLYDPDRSKTVTHRADGQTVPQGWDAFERQLAPALQQFAASGGEGFAVLTESSSSVTLADMKQRFKKRYPNAGWYEYQPISRDEEREGSRLAFGAPHRPQYRLDRADVIVCIDDDLLGSHPAAMRHSRDFARRRDPDSGSMSRLYVIESGYTTTGASADHRLPLRSSLGGYFLNRLQAVLGMEGAAGANIQVNFQNFEDFVAAVADDLGKARGRCLVTVGPNLPREVHAFAMRLNEQLGNVGKTVFYAKESGDDRPTHLDAIRTLASEMNAGRVNGLVILGGNPVYDAPADLAFGDALAKVEWSMHLSLYDDETSRSCGWHLPMAHFLESWADARSWDGSVSLIQPTIAPLYEGKTAAEVLALVTRDDVTAPLDLVRRAFDANVSVEDQVWRRSLHDGFVAGSAWPVSNPTVGGKLPPMPPAGYGQEDVDNGQFEVNFVADSKVYDGRFANNGWLQELPDFMTKLTWDNACLINPVTARKLGVDTGDIVRLDVGGRQMEMVAYLMVGHALGSVTIPLGYGRTAAGVIGGSDDEQVAPVGFNSYRLRGTDNFRCGLGLSIEATGKKYPLSMTQDHHLIDATGAEGRDERLGLLIREGDLAHYNEHRDFVHHIGHDIKPLSLWKEIPLDGDNRWGMAIDLTKCNGCNACVVACQAENNIPIVGKEQVARGREMHWLRIDRYFAGDVRDASVTSQPLPCQQCERAPCEQVCPVGATMHTKDGLNDMVYNRCIGTRYCSNNCPYKVRRFNFFNYHLNLNESENEVMKMVFNPEVTVRARGVMEKCTYCVQRISVARITAKNEKRSIRDGEVVPACAQTCPSSAISFGDLNNPNARVTKDHDNDRAYSLLAELNVRPRTAYLARIHNHNPALAKADPARAH